MNNANWNNYDNAHRHNICVAWRNLYSMTMFIYLRDVLISVLFPVFSFNSWLVSPETYNIFPKQIDPVNLAVNPSRRCRANVCAIYRGKKRWRKTRAENSMVTLRVRWRLTYCKGNDIAISRPSLKSHGNVWGWLTLDRQTDRLRESISMMTGLT